MPATKSLAAYGDCRDLLDRALEAPMGVRIKLDTAAAAVRLRWRLNYYRKRDREESKTIFAADDPRWGMSVYDGLSIALVETSLEIRKLDASAFTVEEL